MSPTDDVIKALRKMRRAPNERAESFARRRYGVQRDILSAWGGHDLLSWEQLDQDIRAQWIKEAGEIS